MSKHTKGPWERSEKYGVALIRDHKDKLLVCTVRTYPSCNYLEPEMHANARLIAAAPDMLECLKQALHIVTKLDPSFNGAIRHWKKIIKKAEGNE